MPKIIPNARSLLLDEARAQIATRGYGKTTVRSVAGACGLSVGVVYNYFPSKDMLIATFMAEDWQACLAHLPDIESPCPRRRAEAIYTALKGFESRHRDLFTDPDAVKVFSAVFSERHRLLRDALSNILRPICKGDDPDFLAQFTAESLLTWTVAGREFEQIWALLSKHFE